MTSEQREAVTFLEQQEAPKPPPRIVALQSAPRLGFTDNFVLIAQLCAMGIPVRKHSGVYWEQCITKLLCGAIEEGFDYALIVDYDSAFKDMDFKYLRKLMMEFAEADAIFPIQYRREANEIILRLDRDSWNKPTSFNQDLAGTHLAPATIGHFGLTLIRLMSLWDLPHPWFVSTPGKDGRWDGEGKVDADIHFWNHFRAHGRKAYVAHRCRIGHIQQMITWPGEDYEVVHQYVGEYFKDGDAPRRIIDAMAKHAGYDKEEQKCA